MTLLHMEGFEDGHTVEKWTTWEGTNDISGSFGRLSGTGVRMDCNFGNCATKTITTIPQGDFIIWGGAVLYNPALSGFNSIQDQIAFMEGGSVHVSLRFRGSDGAITVLRNGTQIGTTSVGVFSENVFFYLEAKVLIADASGGSVELRVNDQQVLNLTGADTRNGGTGDFNQVRHGASGTESTYHDDQYICSTGGSINNDFLGDSRIVVLLPDEDGTTLDWDPSAGSTHYTLLDEATPNTSDFVSSRVVGEIDLVDLSTMPAGSTALTVHGIEGHAYTRKDDAGARKYRLVKLMVRLTMTDPMVHYGKYYYGFNKWGWIFKPLCKFWLRTFHYLGGEHPFVRENGEIV